MTAGYNGVHTVDILVNPHVLCTLGPYLPTDLKNHEMVPLAGGQVILGGLSSDGVQNKLYYLTSENMDIAISEMSTVLSFARWNFVTIPIPDMISGCITGGNLLT